MDLKRVCRVLLMLALTAVLWIGMASTAYGTAFQTGANIMCMPENISEVKIEDREHLGFWGQTAIERADVERVQFHITKANAPAIELFDFSADRDKSVVGWFDEGTLHVAADGPIILSRNSSWMFAHFTNLEEVFFGRCVDASEVEDMSFMFCECRKLESLNIYFLDTSNVRNMEGMFYSCRILENLDVSRMNTANAVSMCRMFGYCEKVDQLDVSGFDTANVQDMSYMFYNCRSLTELDVSGFQTSKTEYMNGMFYGCEKVEKLNVANFDTSNVAGMCYMFAKCKLLKEVDISGFNTGKVQRYTGFMDGKYYAEGKLWTDIFKK